MFKTILNKFTQIFQSSESKKDRDLKELLRENLGLISLDIFYLDDPVLSVPEDRKKEYYKKFYDIVADKDIMERFKFLINKQVRMTIQTSKDGSVDPMGGVNINGIASVKDDFEKFANSYLQSSVPVEPINKFKII